MLKTRVLLLDLGKDFRGGQRQVLYLAELLNASQEFEPVVATPAGAPLAAEALKRSVPFFTLPGTKEWNLLNITKLKREIRERDIRIVHTNDARSAGLGAKLKRVTPGLKLIHSRRVSYPLKSPFSKKKYLAADAVVAVSRDIRMVMEESGVDPGNIHVIHSGIDLSRYPKKASSDEIPVVGIIGSLSKQKGHTVLLEALAEMEKNPIPDFRVFIVGEGPLEDELKQMVERLGLKTKIGFLGRRESIEILPHMDILVVPSVDGEGSSGVIKEAWAVGIPVVVSDLAANLELVEHEKTGFVFPNTDSFALAVFLMRLLDDEALRKSVLPAGKEKVKEFTVERMGKSYCRIYRSVLA